VSNGRVFFAVFGGLVCYVLLGLSGGLWQERGPLSGPNPQRESSALNRRPLLGITGLCPCFSSTASRSPLPVGRRRPHGCTAAVAFGPLDRPGACRQPDARWVMVGVPQAPHHNALCWWTIGATGTKY